MANKKAKPKRVAREVQPLLSLDALEGPLLDAIARDPDAAAAYRAYAASLKDHPLGQVIASQLAAAREPPKQRRLKIEARASLDQYIDAQLVPRYEALAHRLTAFRLKGNAKGGDGLGGSSSASILYKYGLVTSIETWCWTAPMRDQLWDLLRDPHARALEKLCLRDERVDELTPFAHLVALRVLDLRWAKCDELRDLSPLASLRRLEWVDVRRARISDLSPLRSLPLRKLILSGTSVADLSPLAGHRTLEQIDLDATPVRDVTPLLGCPRLCNVSLWETKVKKEHADALKAAMKKTNAEPSEGSDYEPYLSHEEIDWYR